MANTRESRSLQRTFKNLIAATMVLYLGLGGVGIYTVVQTSQHRDRLVSVSHETNATLCERQHTIVDMQRLFLKEHDSIVVLIKEAGVDARPHHDTLKQLERLIEDSECIVGIDVPLPESERN